MKEIWKDIEGYEGFYQISNLGKIKSLYNKWNKGNRILKPAVPKGYYQISLYKNKKRKIFKISILVAKHFIPNPENKPEVNHKDGIKSHNYDFNLEWCTHQENIIHAYKNNLMNNISITGENNIRSKLTASQVRRIKWIANNLKVNRGYWTKMAKTLNITKANLSCIINNKSWKHIII